MIPNPNVKSKEEFQQVLKACGDTMMRNVDKLYDFYVDKTSSLSLSFNFRPDCVLTMDIVCDKLVYETICDEKIKVKEEGEE